MKTIQEVVGLPVLDVSSGKKIGNVKDVFFNETGDLKGLAIETYGIFSKTNYLDFEHVGSIGDDAVTIGTSKFLTFLPSDHSYHGFSSGKKAYKELPVITTNGHELGYITDVYFMEELGKITGYEISDGFLADLTEGRRTIEYPRRMTIGEDALVIPYKEVKDIMLEVE